MGYDDKDFILPELMTEQHVVKADTPRGGYLFDMPAVSLDEQREERRLTLEKRCNKVAELVQDKERSVAWCHLNTEGNLLEKIIPGAVQVSGRDTDEAKEEKLLAFSDGQIKTLITKPQIGAFGLNWQHCNHTTTFPSHSFEQYYQLVRRFYRFGQKNKVKVDIVTSEGESGVMANLQRKEAAADKMFTILVQEMQNELKIDRTTNFDKGLEVPLWL
jgi:hypothetical protein